VVLSSDEGFCEQQHDMNARSYQLCIHCIMDTSDPRITFDEQGRCEYCGNFEATIQPNWDTGAGQRCP
jgi:putative aminotransferase